MRDQMMLTLTLSIIGLLGLLCACAQNGPLGGGGGSGGADNPPYPMGGAAWTGTLRGGIMAIGGESTGWVLEVDDGELAGTRLDTDVSRMIPTAKAFEDRRVRVEGRLIEKAYVERGKVMVLAATSIRSAE